MRPHFAPLAPLCAALLAPAAAAQLVDLGAHTGRAAAFADLGHGVAIDGHRMAGGAWRASTAAGTATGAVHLFERLADGSWVEADVLAPTLVQNNQFVGRDLALDGDTLIAGGAGGALVWERVGGTWSEVFQVGQLNGGYLGQSVALAGDHAFVAGLYQSSVVALERVGGVWTTAPAIAEPTGSWAGNYGGSVACDGTTLVVGSPWIDDAGGLDQSGRVDVFRRQGGAWTWIQSIDPPAPASKGRFGAAVAVDGGRIAVGRPYHPSGVASGAGYLYEEGPGGYALVTEVVGSQTSLQDKFGSAVALEGDTVVFGAFDDFVGGNHSGRAYVFRRDPTGTWSEAAALDGSTTALTYSNEFGFDAALDGGRLVVGSPAAIVTPGVNSGALLLYGVEACSPSNSHLSVSAGGTHQVALDLGPAQAGDLYWLVGSLSGTAPGLPLAPGVVLPLVFDPYTQLLLNAPNQAPWTDSLGFLGATGSATASFTLAAGAPAALAGLTLYHAAAVVDVATVTVELATNAVALSLDA